MTVRGEYTGGRQSWRSAGHEWSSQPQLATGANNAQRAGWHPVMSQWSKARRAAWRLAAQTGALPGGRQRRQGSGAAGAHLLSAWPYLTKLEHQHACTRSARNPHAIRTAICTPSTFSPVATRVEKEKDADTTPQMPPNARYSGSSASDSSLRTTGWLGRTAIGGCKGGGCVGAHARSKEQLQQRPASDASPQQARSCTWPLRGSFRRGGHTGGGRTRQPKTVPNQPTARHSHLYSSTRKKPPQRRSLSAGAANSDPNPSKT